MSHAPDPTHLLERLLVEHFKDDELRRLIAGLPDGSRLAAGLPGPTTTLATLGHEAASLLRRTARIDAALFEALRAERPSLEGRIAAIEEALVRIAAGVARADAGSVRNRARSELARVWEERNTAAALGEDLTRFDARISALRALVRLGPNLQSMDLLGEDRYLLVDLLGRGGFATVWKAWDRVDGQYVAIKVLHGQYVADQSARERFFRGARAMSRLNHPNIVRVVQPEMESDGFYFFVMELVTGGDLRTRVRGGLDQVLGLRAVLEAGRALVYAHEKLGGAGEVFVHRDVKPENILLAADGRARLTDFDLARVDGSVGFTVTQARMGTVGFAAPEQEDDGKRVDGRADVYGLGMTAVYCVGGEQTTRLARKYGERFIEHVEMSARLRDVLRRATTIEVEYRTPTVALFCDELSAALTAPESPRAAALVLASHTTPSTLPRQPTEPRVVRHAPQAPPVVQGDHQASPRAIPATSTLPKQWADLMSKRAARPSLDALRAELGDCQRCRLCEHRKNLVFGAGSPTARLLIVGEAPGAREDDLGAPFVGAAGEMLDRMLENVLKLKRSQVYLTNVVKCRPPENRDPQADELEACRAFLAQQITAVNPTAILAVGRVAAQALLATSRGINALRGEWHQYEGRIPLIATYHPAYLLRVPDDKRKAMDDLLKVRDLLASTS